MTIGKVRVSMRAVMTRARLRAFHVAAPIVVGLAACAPTDAACPGTPFFDATLSYLVSNPNWGGQGGPCGNYGCYDSQSGPPIGPTIHGVFWALGYGNPALRAGDDSGSFDGGIGPGDSWLKQVSAVYEPGGLYHFSAWISLKLGPPYVTGPPISWQGPLIDGCGVRAPGDCTCIMLSDEWGGEGFFATLSAAADALLNTRSDPVYTVRLVEIPAPTIVGSSIDLPTGALSLDVTHPAIAGGTYPKDGCGTCLQGFRVYGQIVPRGATPPLSRTTDWVPLASSTGGTQPIAPLGATTTVRANCDPNQAQDLYVAIALVGEGLSPFVAAHVSAQFGPIECTCPYDDDGDGFSCATDCDDSDPGRHPGAVESCNALDDDCNGLVDDGPLGEDPDTDGILGACDNCPLVFNSSQFDADFDGRGNSCDNCLIAFNPGQENADLDGPGDACDPCTDTDGDGLGNPGFPASTCASDNCPMIASADPSDQDSDGAGDICDNCPIAANPGQEDADADLRGDVCDNCPATANPTQADLDLDGAGDVCDGCTDPDGDGLGDPGSAGAVCALDNCPAVANPDQADRDGDALGDACDACPDDAANDADTDAVCAESDNCPATGNPDQADYDADTLGDACDNCPADSNTSQADRDLDTRGDACDLCAGDYDPSQGDLDHDAVGDACDNCVVDFDPTQADTDFDLTGDVCDNCPLDWNYGQADRDGDRVGDHCDLTDGLVYVTFSADSAVTWQDETGFSTWNVYSGDLAVLRGGGPYTQAPGSNDLAQKSCGLLSTELVVAAPAAGQAAFFLITGTAAGVESTLGTTSAGQTRPNTHPCP